jgi:hypothetical protein
MNISLDYNINLWHSIMMEGPVEQLPNIRRCVRDPTLNPIEKRKVAEILQKIVTWNETFSYDDGDCSCCKARLNVTTSLRKYVEYLKEEQTG